MYLNNPELLIEHILNTLYKSTSLENYFLSNPDSTPSAVLFLLGQHYNKGIKEPCLILNKRSQKVRQPGDLCCPGGGMTPYLDSFLGKLLTLPGFPVKQWPYWASWKDANPNKARQLSIFLANGLREGFEEMRLNPFGVRFLGPLPPQPLIMFRRIIYPLAGWVSRQKHFFPNWEVDKIVYIPLRQLLNPHYYACFRPEFSLHIQKKMKRKTENFPCFLYQNGNEKELLWGATYRITAAFLELIFGFRPPEPAHLPVISETIGRTYLTGNG